jgi:hypothetical protein
MQCASCFPFNEISKEVHFFKLYLFIMPCLLDLYEEEVVM